MYIKEGTVLKFYKAYPVPFALQQQIEKELNRLESLGIIEHVCHSEWASPVVPVPKQNGQMRLCVDFKVTLNPVLEIDQYPLPRVVDLLSSLSGGDKFTKIDLTSAYQQMLVEEHSRQYVTVNIHKGLYRYTRFTIRSCFGSRHFSKDDDVILQGIPRVIQRSSATTSKYSTATHVQHDKHTHAHLVLRASATSCVPKNTCMLECSLKSSCNQS